MTKAIKYFMIMLYLTCSGILLLPDPVSSFPPPKDAVLPLHTLISSSVAKEVSTEDVLKLIKETDDLNALDHKGNSPLHHAVLAGREDIVEALISKGADVNIKDKGGRTPLYVAGQLQLFEIASKLIINGADIHIKSNIGGDALAGFQEDQRKLLIGLYNKVNDVTPVETSKFDYYKEKAKRIFGR